MTLNFGLKPAGHGCAKQGSNYATFHPLLIFLSHAVMQVCKWGVELFLSVSFDFILRSRVKLTIILTRRLIVTVLLGTPIALTSKLIVLLQIGAAARLGSCQGALVEIT